MNIKNRQTAKFALILAIIALMAGLSSCDRVHEIIEPETFETDGLVEERDHVWVVDQNGDEVPVHGTWVLVSHTHLSSTSTIGESFTLPAYPPHSFQVSDGTYTDGEGVL